MGVSFESLRKKGKFQQHIDAVDIPFPSRPHI
jgi:hypothetical protein